MAPNETTFLEPPATPAPLFAYRALRGFIFGSPDPNESPESVPQVNGKENIVPPLLASPSKRKRSGDTLAPPISPAKGILRTPGALTPRAKALRDVTVKFRSVSPEVRRKDVKHEAGVLAKTAATTTVTTPAPAKHKEEPKKKNPNDATANTSRSEQLPKAPTSASASTAISQPSAFDDYQRRTERQMKTLIADRNKWRDLARRAGDENSWLKVQLAQARRENERLEKKLRMLEQSQSRQRWRPSDQDEHGHLAKKRRTRPKSDKDDPSNTAVIAPSLPLRTRSPLPSLGQELESEPRPELISQAQVVARTGLAPERYTAARARLQARQQARKASSNGLKAGGEHMAGTKMDGAEESHIDWAGLAFD